MNAEIKSTNVKVVLELSLEELGTIRKALGEVSFGFSTYLDIRKIYDDACREVNK